MKDIYEKLNKKKQLYDIVHSICVFMFITLIISIVILAGFFDEVMFIVLAVPALFFGAIGFYIQILEKDMALDFKRRYVKMIYQRLIKNSEYVPGKGFTKKEINSSEIFPFFDLYDSDDLIIGVHNGIEFKTADINLMENIKTKYGSGSKSFFKGRLYIFDFNKVFKQNIVVAQKKVIFGNHNPGNVKTESIEFNSEFRVFSEIEEEGFYILTPHIMESMLELDKKYKDRIIFSFNMNKLFISTYGKSNPLDFHRFKKIDDSFVQGFIDEFNDIINIIKVLQLEVDIFK